MSNLGAVVSRRQTGRLRCPRSQGRGRCATQHAGTVRVLHALPPYRANTALTAISASFCFSNMNCCHSGVMFCGDGSQHRRPAL